MAAVPAVASAPGAPSAPGVPAPGAPPVHVSPKDPPTRCTPPRAVFKFEDHRYTYEYGGFATWAEGQTRGTAVGMQPALFDRREDTHHLPGAFSVVGQDWRGLDLQALGRYFADGGKFYKSSTHPKDFQAADAQRYAGRFAFFPASCFGLSTPRHLVMRTTQLPGTHPLHISMHLLSYGICSSISRDAYE